MATVSFAARWFASGVDVTALSAAPVVDFDRRDDLQTQWLARRGVPAAAPPRHRVPASQDFATAVQLGLGWGLLPGFQSDAALRGRTRTTRRRSDRRSALLAAVEPHLALLDEVADEVVDEGRRMLAG